MIKVKELFFLLIFFICINKIQSQFSSFEWISPVEIPVFLSGNFGEIRSDHFHTGIDIKTMGVTGHKVFAIADGYVSRIKIQANGYGKALYITHKNGYTSVYCHLDRFNDEIKSYVENEQYKKKSFEIDLYLDKETFIVSKGDLIALSGNSGGSAGPHLHFEIRDQNQQPLNVLKFNMKIQDEVAPVPRSVVIYPLEDGQVNKSGNKLKLGVKKNNGNYTTEITEIQVSGKIGFGLEVYDYQNGTNNRCGIYSLELEIDSQLINQFFINSLSFDYLRYVNAHIDYYERIANNLNIHRLFRLPNNKLGIYNYINNDGIIEMNDTLMHHIRITSRDAKGNSSVIDFDIRGTEKQLLIRDKNVNGNSRRMSYKQLNSFLLNDIKIIIPEDALYEDIDFRYIKTDDDQRFRSPVYYIHDEFTPLHKSITLAIKPDSIDEKSANKACLAVLDKNDEPLYIGGRFKNGFVETKTKVFGRYIVYVDSVSPQVLPVNFVNRSNMQNYSGLIVQIKDDFSGINEYAGYIDNSWVLFDYDKKNNTITYIFDQNRLEKNKWHDLKIVVKDYLDNSTLKNYSFFW